MIIARSHGIGCVRVSRALPAGATRSSVHSPDQFRSASDGGEGLDVIVHIGAVVATTEQWRVMSPVCVSSDFRGVRRGGLPDSNSNIPVRTHRRARVTPPRLSTEHGLILLAVRPFPFPSVVLSLPFAKGPWPARASFPPTPPTQRRAVLCFPQLRAPSPLRFSSWNVALCFDPLKSAARQGRHAHAPASCPRPATAACPALPSRLSRLLIRTTHDPRYTTLVAHTRPARGRHIPCLSPASLNLDSHAPPRRPGTTQFLPRRLLGFTKSRTRRACCLLLLLLAFSALRRQATRGCIREARGWERTGVYDRSNARAVARTEDGTSGPRPTRHETSDVPPRELS
ncbi:hypothetical protein CALCODRAFT_28483 [Calocera cornea HHB12733]|uniref:Uncharacterized protein n=1 Tax=Calocera cornea HHB12733 TaxID=1353952 RepID=A0A165E397_9BASI|nr:hypothetical protein CALCODRAFT_28483 [Calocera cornea HHB12733]